jgi:glycine betaine/proline transport system permease protein
LTAASLEVARPRRRPLGAAPYWLGAAILAALSVSFSDRLPEWMVEYPRAWRIPIEPSISAAMKWLINDATFGLFTFQQFTRSIAWCFNWLLEAAYGVLAEGFTFGKGEDALHIPHVSWIALIIVLVMFARRVGDRGLMLFVGFCFAYLAVFGQWASAMVTLASIVISVPFGVAAGLLVGIAAYRKPWVERAVTPVLDLMQTVPVFAYLVPILFLFGFGPVAAMIATMIYAAPPMVRLTVLALRGVPEEIKEYGRMAGCSQRQHMWKVMVPAAKSGLLVGLNQVVMLSLNMVIIASMIGAGGLGFDVLHALRRLAIGEGLEAGIAITLLAIALDRLSQAAANRPPPAHGSVRAGSWFVRNRLALAALALMVFSMAAGTVVPVITDYPASMTVTTGKFWDHVVQWLNINLYDTITIVKTWLLVNIMLPVKGFMVALPWPVLLGILAFAGWRLGGWRLALLPLALGAFILVTGNWEKAMITIYLCGLSVVIAALIGIPLGIWAAVEPRRRRATLAVIDTLQTLPSFVYLIPVIMLFGVGDFSAMIAVVAYALAPAVRYSIHGLRQVPEHLVEAGRAQGCSRGQMLWKVRLPLALPEIMLGINQTIMMALSMLVITALVGTRDLGQEVFTALAKADTGKGIVAGLCVAFIAITADRLIQAWSRRRKAQLGIA